MIKYLIHGGKALVLPHKRIVQSIFDHRRGIFNNNTIFQRYCLEYRMKYTRLDGFIDIFSLRIVIILKGLSNYTRLLLSKDDNWSRIGRAGRTEGSGFSNSRPWVTRCGGYLVRHRRAESVSEAAIISLNLAYYRQLG